MGTPRHLPPARRAAAVLVPAALALLAAACQVPSSLPGPMDAKEQALDDQARFQYYTDAAKTYYEGGKYDAAVAMWDKALGVRPDDPWAKFGLAKALHMVGTTTSLRRAERVLQEILPLDWTHPTQGDVRYRLQTTLAAVYTDLADFYDRDVRTLDARLEEEPSPDAAAQLRVQKQTQIAKRNELLQRSIPLFEAVLVASTDDPYALAGLAKANLLLGNDVAGIDYAKRYLALSQKSQVQWRERLELWKKLQGQDVTQEQRAILIRKIQGAREKEKAMHLLLGSVYMRRDEFADAVAEYDAVLTIDPASAPAYVERAQAYARLGQYALAVQDVEEYLKLTDPVKQRKARLEAADLLDRYRRLAGMGPSPESPPVPTPPAAAPAPPAPTPPR